MTSYVYYGGILYGSEDEECGDARECSNHDELPSRLRVQVGEVIGEATYR